MHLPKRCNCVKCPNSQGSPQDWFTRFGFYRTEAHGLVQRYRCKRCHSTFSEQSRSLHYYAKRRLPLAAVWSSLLEGASMREIARRYHTTPAAVQGAILRLGRQAMALQLRLLEQLRPRNQVVYDGLRTCVTSQDYPCDITTVVDPQGETILTMTHTVMRRGGNMTPSQRSRLRQKLQVWSPEPGKMSQDISLTYREIWDYLRAPEGGTALIDTDEQPLYRSQLRRDPVGAHFVTAGKLKHRCTPGSAPRTIDNRLFAVNYVDRLLRHRLKEHTRETIAIGRNAVMQMHRAWIFAVDHNCLREYRVKRPDAGCHAAQGAVGKSVVSHLTAGLFAYRFDVEYVQVPTSIRQVWEARLPGPPLRWKTRQKGTSLRVPGYAFRDLGPFSQHSA